MGQYSDSTESCTSNSSAHRSCHATRGRMPTLTCCQCQGIEQLFGKREAMRRLRAYLRRGSDKTTRLLVDALLAEGIEGATLLDIGGGVGALQLELLSAGLH